MTHYARIINGAAVDVSTDPKNCFHPLVAAEFVKVPAEVTHGWVVAEGKWSPPVAYSMPVLETVYPTITPETFLQLFTYQEVKAVERLAKGDATAKPVLEANEELAYWWERINSPRLTEVQMGLPSVQDALQGLVALGVLSEARLTQVNAIQLV